MTASVTIDRTSLALSDLVITDDGSGTFTLTPGGLGAMGVKWQRKFASSPRIHGDFLVSARKVNSNLPLQVFIQASSEANRNAAIAELDAAFSQFDYTIDTEEDGMTWRCSPADWSIAGNAVKHTSVSQFLEVVNVVIPVHPVPVS